MTLKNDDRNVEQMDKAEVVINILLNNPSDFELKHKPSGIRKNFVCTLNSELVSIENARADDNGAYLHKGCPKRFYYVEYENGTIKSCATARSENGVYYVNDRRGAKYMKRTVQSCDVYELTRMYRQSKNNPKFMQTIASLRKADSSKPLQYYLLTYRWMDNEEHDENDFILPRHGNATKPHAGVYYKQNPELKKKALSKIENGDSSAKVYRDLVIEAKVPSEEPRDPKYIHNIKAQFSQQNKVDPPVIKSECEMLIKQMKEKTTNMRNLIMLPDHYISFNSTEQMLQDLIRFCVNGNSILVVDTTFELCDGLWLTDSSFQNEALVNNKGEHPVFPGPYMWHFKKTREVYRRLALEIVNECPLTIQIKKVGHDLDEAVGSGLADVFVNAKRLYCTEHLQKADIRQLQNIGANKRSVDRIMSDIYGTNVGLVEQLGLADAEDTDDFDAKVTSIESVWENLVPGFHSWFLKHRSLKFKQNLVLDARSCLNISGRFYSNGLESAHRLQKKFLADELTSSNITSVNESLSEWVAEFYKEAVRALRGVGRYRLAVGYEQFFVEHVKWNQWSPVRRQQHVDVFMKFIPKSAQLYKKPSVAGLKKAPRESRRVENPEPALFMNRISAVCEQVSPLKLARQKDPKSTTWTVLPSSSKSSNVDFDPLNPDRFVDKVFQLVHRDDKKNCPLSVKRCHSCRRLFTKLDCVLVKTEGDRDYTNKQGKQVNMEMYTFIIFAHVLWNSSKTSSSV